MENETKKEETAKAAGPLRDSNEIFSAFKQKFSTTVHSIYVNSLGKSVSFRDVTVNEQKTLSKTTIENESRKDLIYDAQCQLINQLCLEEGFSVYRLTEFDRIRILAEIYQSNYFKSDITYKCKECGAENTYKLDFQKIIDRMNSFDLQDKIYSVEDGDKVFKFTVNFPNVRTVSNFYKDYSKRYRGLDVKERQILDNMGTIEYVNLFIKQVEMIEKSDPNSRLAADLTLMTYAETERFIDMFPQNVIFSENGGVMSFITENFIGRLNGIFQYEKCQHCGAETTEGIGSLGDFF